MTVIQIKGIPGSGKTYICSKLTNVICLDTDNYVTNAYHKLLKDNKNISPDLIFKLAQRMLNKDIIKSKNTDTIVVVGITLNVVNPDYKFFIKMNKEDLYVAYKRVIIREIEKINNLSISKIKKMDVNDIRYFIEFGNHVNAFDIRTGIQGYLKTYKNAVKHEKKNGFKFLSQKDIIDKLNNL